MLSQSNTADLLEDAISATLPVEIRNVLVDGGIVADVVVTVDTSNAENNLNTAAENVGDTFEARGYSSNVESIKISLEYFIFCVLKF